MSLYVAYGSNINTEQMMFRCPDAEIYATGMVQDYELRALAEVLGTSMDWLAGKE